MGIKQKSKLTRKELEKMFTPHYATKKELKEFREQMEKARGLGELTPEEFGEIQEIVRGAKKIMENLGPDERFNHAINFNEPIPSSNITG